jgi:hypothetical protein
MSAKPGLNDDLKVMIIIIEFELTPCALVIFGLPDHRKKAWLPLFVIEKLPKS